MSVCLRSDKFVLTLSVYKYALLCCIIITLDTSVLEGIHLLHLGLKRQVWTKCLIYKQHTVKPRPEAHMDIILFEEYPLDSTRSDSTIVLSII